MHPFDFARAGRQQARSHLAALIADDRHVPLFADPPDSLGLAVEDALGREMADEEFAEWRTAYAARFEQLADDHRDRLAGGDIQPRYWPAEPSARVPSEIRL